MYSLNRIPEAAVEEEEDVTVADEADDAALEVVEPAHDETSVAPVVEPSWVDPLDVEAAAPAEEVDVAAPALEALSDAE